MTDDNNKECNPVENFFRGASKKVKAFFTDSEGNFNIGRAVCAAALPVVITAAVIYYHGDTQVSQENVKPTTEKSVVLPETGEKKDSTETKPFVVDTQVREAYNRAVKKTKPFLRAQHEIISVEQVDSIVNNIGVYEPVVLRDTDYNHRPTDKENFWEIVTNASKVAQEVLQSDELTEEQKHEYAFATYMSFSKISIPEGWQGSAKDADIDLSLPNNLQAFNYAERLLEYRDNYDKMFDKKQGHVASFNDIYGRYYQDQVSLTDLARQNQGIVKFTDALYNSTEQFILNQDDNEQIMPVAQDIYNSFLERQGISQEEAQGMVAYSTQYGSNATFVQNSSGYDFYAYVEVNPNGELDNGKYLPAPLTKLHELQHVMQETPASDSVAETSDSGKYSIMYELGPTLYSLAVQDGIYKELHGLDKDEIADYSGEFELNGRQIKVSEVANFARKMFLDKYPDENVDAVVMKPEFMEQFNRWNEYGCNYIAEEQVQDVPENNVKKVEQTDSTSHKVSADTLAIMQHRLHNR